MWQLARLDFYRFFITPLAWTVLGVSQLLLAYLFLTHINYFTELQAQTTGIPGAPGVTETVIAPLLQNAGLIFLLLVPLLTMRSFAGERQQQTLVLLTTSPLSATQLVMGKWLALAGFFTLALALSALMPLSLLLGAEIDLYQLASGYLGLWLLVMSFTAIGIFVSVVTPQSMVAAIVTFTVLLLLWILDIAGESLVSGSGLFHWLSMMTHFQPMLAGDVYRADIAYFIIITAAFLLMSIRQLDQQRVSP